MNILLVDDELLVRTKLKYLIEIEIPKAYNEINFIICGEASNGAEALEKIDKLYPDIIISDMKMPIMDGLALCRICRERYPECFFLVLSNYDDFSYVKESLLLGASDYLLKHSLDAESLYSVLKKIYDKQRPRDREHAVVRIDALKDEIFHNLLGGVYIQEQQIASDIKTFDLPIPLHQVVPVMMWIQEYEDGEFKKNNILAFSVKNIVNEIFKEQKNGIICHTNGEKYALLLGYEELRSQEKIREFLTFSLNRIRFCMKSFLGLSVYFIVGHILPSIFLVGEEYHALEIYFQSSFYQERDIWLSESVIEDEKKEIFFFSTDDERQLIYELISGNREAVSFQLKNLFDCITKSKPSEAAYKLTLARVFTCLKKAAEQCMIKPDDLFQGEFSEEKILNGKSVRKMQDALNQICLFFFEEKNKKNPAGSIYIQNAVAFIHQHFKENISQTDVADHVGISSVYLSILSKTR